ncbi:hypothetical protein BDW74DRAFT_174913 [Aspergillus multicolor]|uniref:uncharacterized protein n=1 Tax=Aspergillus multicolor TaxID=41759 RepID=UPI003CCD1FFB
MVTRVSQTSRLLLQSRRLSGLPRPLVHVRHNHTGALSYRPTLRNPKRDISPFVNARQSHTGSAPVWPTWNFDATQIKTTGSKLLEPHWASQDLSVVDNLIDHQTVRQFLMFLGDAGDLQELQDALNARRELQNSNGDFAELNLVGLWGAFIHARYETMIAAAHSWVLSRVAELREHTINELYNAPQANKKMGSEELKVYVGRVKDLTEIAACADIMIWMSLDGYAGYQPSAEVTPGLHYPDLEAQRRRYQERLTELTQAIHMSSFESKLQIGPLQTLAALRIRFSITAAAQDLLRK